MGEPTYYAKGETVFKAPIRRENPDGSTSITVGFPVCDVTDYVSAQNVADVLIAGEGSDALAAERDALQARVREATAALKDAEELYQLGILNAPDYLSDRVRDRRRAFLSSSTGADHV